MAATPVDVGTARSNWIARRGAPPTHKRKAFAPGSHLGVGERANLANAYASAIAVFNAAKPGEPLYLKNNLNYITRLNQGHSKQAPSGFVDTSLLQQINELKRIRLLA